MAGKSSRKNKEELEWWLSKEEKRDISDIARDVTHWKEA